MSTDVGFILLGLLFFVAIAGATLFVKHCKNTECSEED